MATTGKPMPMRALPLTGVRVLAQAIVWAGPFGSLILADLGADVIEVESIQHLNPTRAQLRHFPPAMLQGPTGAIYANRDGSEGFWNRSSNFNYSKRGHLSVTVDLNRDEGRALFFGLVREADIFIENNAADVMDSLGIGWEVLSVVNPRLIMMRFPGFGLDGPYAHFKGFGAQMEAVVGHTMLRGYADSDPSETPPIYHGDPNAGAHVAFAVQAALFARARTGQGQLIEMSQAEAVIHHTSYGLMDYAMNQRITDHWGNRHPWMAPYGLYPCVGERRWLALAVGTDTEFAALCTQMARADLATDARFADAASRYRHQDALDVEIAAWTAGYEVRPLMEQLQAAGVPAAEVCHQEEMIDHPHLRAREFFITLDHPDVGVKPYPGPMARFEQLPLVPVRGRAPRLGEHNREVLRDLAGVDDARYQQLVDAAIIGTAYVEDTR